MTKTSTVIPTLLTLALLFSSTASVEAGTVHIPGLSGSGLNVQVTSRKEALYSTTVPQHYDFSCGSAALATLLTHHYGTNVTEQELFTWMYEKGEQEKIRREGFSLLDMKNCLKAKGFQADGFYASLDKLADAGIPAIVLLDLKGYRHFVVVKGVTDKRVLIGDPASGIKVMKRDDFEEMWNGLVFIIRNRTLLAENNFNRLDEWRVQGQTPMGSALQMTDLAKVTYLLSGPEGAGP